MLSDRIEMLTQQLQLQAEPRELVSGPSSQKLVLRIQASGREGEIIGAGLPIRILTDSEGVRIPGELSLDKEGKAERLKFNCLPQTDCIERGFYVLPLWSMTLVV